MSVTLSAVDLVRLETALRVLLSPLDYATTDAWRCAVNRCLRDLLGADKAVFGLSTEVEKPYFSEEWPLAACRSYESYYGAMDTGWALAFEREWTVFDESMIYDMQALRRTEYYADFILPNGGHDALLMAYRPSPDLLAALMFHHERLGGPRFGERGLALLRLLFPAFRAGIATLRLEPYRGDLARVLDTLEVGLLVCDATGRALHKNAALLRMLSSEAEREIVLGELQGVARALCDAGRNRDGGKLGAAAEAAWREVRTARFRYRLRGSLLREGALAAAPCVLVALEPLALELPSERTLQERFGLTRREARVALLLARRKTNAEIAQELILSPHTARHHTESVLRKLGVHARTDVLSRIQFG